MAFVSSLFFTHFGNLGLKGPLERGYLTVSSSSKMLSMIGDRFEDSEYLSCVYSIYYTG